MVDNVNRIVQAGVCTGCGACAGCRHLVFQQGPLGFQVPVIDQDCTHCGKCVAACIFDPLREDDE